MNLLRGKPSSLLRGPLAELLCMVGGDYTPTLQERELVPSVCFTLRRSGKDTKETGSDECVRTCVGKGGNEEGLEAVKE